MEGLSSLVLGLGLFFLGIQLVGENLRRLSGRSFRKVMQRVAERPMVAAVTGVGFGAAMQSATAVTFVLAGMQKSGLVSATGAAPVILWCNVGLTALVFLAALNIHPLVAYFTGATGILAAMIRQSLWRSVAGGLLGIGLIMFGLQSMSAGAEPLKNQEWFQAMLTGAVSSPVIAFGVGILAAALLQSNTGAAMLVIALAAAGEFKIEQAALLIYGSNLGAIGLRFILSMNLDSASQRLVRFEDIFCLWTSVVMVVLTLIETTGLPGPLTLARWIAPDSLQFQLAVLFLLSNLIPAILVAPFTSKILGLLQRWIPDREAEAFTKPMFLSDTAWNDPGTAADLALHESARLIGSLTLNPLERHGNPSDESTAPADFVALANEIEQFLAQVATSSRMSQGEAHRIHLVRSELGVIRYLEEAVRDFRECLYDVEHSKSGNTPVPAVVDSLSQLLDLATKCTERPTAAALAEFREATRKNHPAAVKAKGETKAHAADLDQKSATRISALCDAYDLAVWMLHRLSKTLERTLTGE